MFRRHKQDSPKKTSEAELRCSFCNKAQHEVRKLIAGPTVFICDECVQVCNDIIADDNRFERRELERREPPPQPPPPPPDETRVASPLFAGRCSMCGLPVVLDEALGVPERGFLCAGCVDAIEAALADRSDAGPP